MSTKIKFEKGDKGDMDVIFPRGKIPAVDISILSTYLDPTTEKRKKITLVKYSDTSLPECVSLDPEYVRLYLQEYEGIQIKSIEPHGDYNTLAIIVKRKTAMPSVLEKAIENTCDSHGIDFRINPDKKDFLICYSPSKYIFTLYDSMPEHLRHPHAK